MLLTAHPGLLYLLLTAFVAGKCFAPSNHGFVVWFVLLFFLPSPIAWGLAGFTLESVCRHLGVV